MKDAIPVAPMSELREGDLTVGLAEANCKYEAARGCLGDPSRSDDLIGGVAPAIEGAMEIVKGSESKDKRS